MPENNSLPSPNQILGEPKQVTSKSSVLPSPDQILNVPQKSSGTDYSAILQNVTDSNQLENTLDDIVKTSRTAVTESEKGILRDLLANPNTTPEQAKEAINTVQGYDKKYSRDDDRTLYYMKRDDNGVMMPKALAYGERPPKGYDVKSVWGNQTQSDDDSWYTDLGKSLYNGVLGAVKGVTELGQAGVMGATGTESKFLNSVVNTAEALQFEKDQALDTPLFNAQGVKEWTDIADKDRFDLSPTALWGTLNMAAESVTSFMVGAFGAAGAIKGGKGLAQGLKGLDEAIELGKAGVAASAFTGSFLTQLGDNLENAKDAGLEGREAAAWASLTTSGQAAIDATLGIESKIFRNMMRKPTADMIRTLSRTVERDAAGQITDAGFRELVQGATLGYGEIAKSMVKQVGKDALREGAQETAQDMIAKGAENLWDKMSDDDKKKFGTNAASPEAFASYIQNGLAGIVSGGPMSLVSNKVRKNYEKQAQEAFRVVREGGEAEMELRSNLEVARDKGTLSQEEYDTAVTKLNAYAKYNEQSKDLKNLSEADKEKMFRLSFNIEALQNEINIPKEDLEKLDPIAIGKIAAKKELVNGLEKEIKDLILKNEVQTENEVGQQTVDRVDKNEDPEAEKTDLKDLVSRIKPEETERIDVLEETKPTRRKIEEVETDEWNALTTSRPLEIKKIVQEHLKNTPGNEMDGVIRSGQNGVLTIDIGDNKQLRFGQSRKSTKEGEADYLRFDNLPKTKVYEEDKGGDADLENEGEPVFHYEEPVSIKRVEIESFDEEGKKKKEKKAVLSVYNKDTGKHIGFVREHDKGKSTYTPKEIEQLNSIIDANHLTDEIAQFTRPKEEVKAETKPKPKEKAVSAEQEKVDQINQTFEAISESAKNAGLDNIIEKITKGEEVVFTKPASIEAAQKNDLYNVEVQKDGSAKVVGVFNPKTNKWIGKEKSKSKEKKTAITKADQVKKGDVIENVDGKRGTVTEIKDGLITAKMESGAIMQGNPKVMELFRVEKETKPKPETKPEPKKETMVEDIEISKAERETLLDLGYDNVTINKAVAEANRLRKLPVKELFNKLSEKGVFNLGKGDTFVERPDIGLTSAEYNTSLNQLEKNKDTKTIEKLINFVEDIKETGIVKTIRGTGGMAERFSAPLHRSLLEAANQERGLTEQEEKEELEKETAREKHFEETGEFYAENNQNENSNSSKLVNELTSLVDFPNEYILKHISKYITDPAVKKILDAMIKNSSRINTFVKFKGVKKMTHGGLFYPSTGEIYINDVANKWSPEDIARVITHEYIHAYTVKALWAQKYEQEKEFFNNINSIYQELKRNTNYPKEYGFTNVLEFVSEISSNPDFINKLKSNNRNIFQRIIDAIKRLFGIKNDSELLVDKAIKSILEFIPDSLPTKMVGNYGPLPAAKLTTDEITKKIKELSEEKNLSKYSYEQLVDLYNDIIVTDFPGKKKEAMVREVMVRIAMNIHDRQVKQNIKDNPQYSPDSAIRKDITPADIKLKVLSHFTDQFPTLQFLDKMWDSAYFDMETQAVEQKNINEKLAKKVIADRNKRIGLATRGIEFLQSLYSNINHKYFDYLDNGKGELITVDEAKKKNLSEVQIEYLKYVRELIAKRQGLIGDPKIYDMDMEVLRLDKKFYEAWRSEGITQAFSNLLGNTHSLENVRIEFLNPLTNKEEITEFKNIEKMLVEYGKKGVAEKAKSLRLMMKYNIKARRQLKEGRNYDQNDATNENVLKVAKGGEYTLDENGQLQSKFSRKRDSSRAYSKDFYRAVQEYIDDNAHIEHISPLVPVINAIEYLNKNGAVRDGKTLHGSKSNVGQWLEEWTKMHVLKKQNEGVPELDLALRTLRFMTSATTMLFNVSANIMNVAIGNYNNIRQEEGKTWAIGQSRLFGGKNRKATREYGYGTLNKYAMDILRKYKAISTDVDSNPIRTAGGLFADLGFLGQKWGEFQIQGSGLLGLMSDEDYNSFEYKTNTHGIEEMVVKQGVDEKALKERILKLRNRVSDVQGKYSAKDQRNIMNNELGKAVMQFKVWIPDWYRMRFSKDAGSWNKMLKGGFAELRNDMKQKGTVKAFWENKAFMSNLKGAMFTALLMSFVYRDDDDEKKSTSARMLEKGLSDVLFIFDPENLKFTLTRPIASMGIIEKFIDLLDHIMALESDDFYKGQAKYGDKGDSKIIGDLIGLTPGKKVIDPMVEMLNSED